MNEKVEACTLSGTVQVPASKSDGQRALLAATLADGASILMNVGQSKDELAMRNSCLAIGARFSEITAGLQVIGAQNFPSKLHLNCGESGLGLRLLASVCAAHDGDYELNGEGSLLLRDHHFFTTHFQDRMRFCTLEEGRLPLRLAGPLKGENMEVDGSASSQYISGLLMALPLLKENSILKVDQLNSRPYVDMTIATLKAFGIRIEEMEKDCFSVAGEQSYRACEYTVEGDWSAGSYWLAAAILGHSIRIAGLQAHSLQADRALLEAIELAGGEIVWKDGLLTVHVLALRTFQFNAQHCPDLFPALVTIAAFCPGRSVISGVHRLANKESNRALSLQEEFGKLGVRIELHGDEMYIFGGNPLKSTRVSSHNDHRIAMCLAIAATRIPGGLEIEGAEAVAKSYPEFWNDLFSRVQVDH